MKKSITRTPKDLIKDFLLQDEELEAFMTGPAGSGKTTELGDIISYLNSVGVTYLVVAYTHQAKDVLVSKLPEGTPVKTLHSWLKKRPGINEHAKHTKAIMISRQFGKPMPLQLLIVDEFSFVGEKDYFDIGALQDEIELPKGVKPLKVFYVGDLNQLSPIDGPPAVMPGGNFWLKLTKIHRTTNTLSKPLSELVEMIEGDREMAYLEPTEHFNRKVDIDKLYMDIDSGDKIMLAFTNEATQHHNALIQGHDEPLQNDVIYLSNMKKHKVLDTVMDHYEGEMMTINGKIDEDTKYNPVKYLNQLPYVKYFKFSDGTVVPGIFGSNTGKQITKKLGKKLVASNRKGSQDKKVFREYKTVNDYVEIMDFFHCLTIHKSQGTEFSHVFLDSEDLKKCFIPLERLKLMYVALSRAKESVFCNN